MRASLTALTVAGGFFLWSSAIAEEYTPKELSEADVVNELQTIKQSNLMKLAKPLVIDGEMRFNGWFIVTDRVVFRSGARLIFTKQALENRRNFFLVAKELITEDASAPGLITYEQPPMDIANAKPGQGSTGSYAKEDGHRGGPGGAGEAGVIGPKGYSAPSITITTLAVPSSGPAVDFRGGQGGRGGQGQRGGDGGAGAKGSPASQSLFDCKAGGGRGGDGGAGGQGGDGGIGGSGGDGGAVIIIAPAGLLPSLSQKFRVLVSGGPGGMPGDPGPGGNGGPGGPGGQEAKPYCGGGSGGNGGPPGATGQAGASGTLGTDGDFFVGAITVEEFNQIY